MDDFNTRVQRLREQMQGAALRKGDADFDLIVGMVSGFGEDRIKAIRTGKTDPSFMELSILEMHARG